MLLFMAGLFIGAIAGVLVVALCRVAHDADEEAGI